MKLQDLLLDVIPATPDLRSPAVAVELAEEIGEAALVIIDTLAATTPGGNENSAEDVGPVLANCHTIAAKTGATVLLIHHSGKDASRGARGWSGLRAAVDAEIEVKRCGDMRSATVTKFKDGEDGEIFSFQLVPVIVDMDFDGDDVTSCVVKHVESTPRTAIKEAKGRYERVVMQTVRLASEERVSTARVISEALDRIASPKDGRDRRKERLSRAIRSLEERGALHVLSGEISLPHAPRSLVEGEEE